MVKEKHKFLLRQRIREPKTDDGKIIDLEQEFELEVNWTDKNVGEIERQQVVFEKNGKKYKFELDAKIKKGWFKDRMWISSFGMNGELFKQNFTMENMGGKAQIVPLQTRVTGWFFVGGFLLLLFLGIGGYFLWKKRQK